MVMLIRSGSRIPFKVITVIILEKYVIKNGIRAPTPNPMMPPRGRENYGLNQELIDYLSPLGTDGTPDAYFTGALGYRSQHNIHYSDSADQQANAGYRPQHNVECSLRGLGLSEQCQRNAHYIILFLMKLFQHSFDARRYGLNVLRLIHLDNDLV
ncbi:unnamed protein product [marine sediment metagenome]|uniref:Uncharacterized protein n=1 Tax=marine sediment metagenome TaxID=412755 RepID=X1HE30_9ZZZZ